MTKPNENHPPEGSARRAPGRPRRWTPRTTAWLTLAGVSVVAGVISYSHALAVVEASGAGWLVSHVQPLLADLVILGASANLLDASRAGGRLPKWSMAAAGTGGAVTLWMNVAASNPHSVPFWVVNGWPPVAFGLALESLLGLIRRGRDGAVPAVPAALSHAQPPEPPTTDEALSLLLASGSQRDLAAALGVTKYRVEAWSAQVADPAEPGPELATAGLNGNGAHGPA